MIDVLFRRLAGVGDEKQWWHKVIALPCVPIVGMKFYFGESTPDEHDEITDSASVYFDATRGLLTVELEEEDWKECPRARFQADGWLNSYAPDDPST